MSHEACRQMLAQQNLPQRLAEDEHGNNYDPMSACINNHQAGTWLKENITRRGSTGAMAGITCTIDLYLYNCVAIWHSLKENRS